MKHITLFILLAISSLLVNAQGWMWAKHFNGTGSNQPVSISQDNVGNYYVYGNFKNQVTQDAITLNSYSGSQDIFLAKYNPLGEVQWIKQIGGTGTETAYSLCFNSDYSSFYITGNFNNTFNIEGTYLNTIGGLDVFMAKFSANGTLDWAKNVAYGTINQTSSGICIDTDGNIVLVGMFLDNVSFYGGVYTLTSPIPSVRQNFIAKFNSSGIPLWSKMIDGDNAASYIRSVSTNNNEYYFSGQYMGTLDFGTSSITNSNSNRDGFVYKTNTNGDFQWVREISGSNYDEYIIRHVQDGTGNVYTGGYFYSSSLVIDSTATVTSNVAINNHYSGKSDIVILKYSSDGTLQWVKAYGSNKDDVISDIYATQNNVLFTGSYSDSINFNGFNLLNSGGSDAFTAVCSSYTGIVSSALKAAGPNNDYGKTCFYNSNERNFVTSGDFFSTSLTIGSYAPFTNSVQDLTTRDAYIARYGCFDSVGTSFNNVTCNGANNGTATATPTIGSAPYYYTWSNAETTATISNLTPGTYSVTVTTDISCSATASVTITQPNVLTSDSSQTNVSCYGGSDGTATVIPSGGTPSYSYLWSNSQTTATAIDLVAGIYNVTVTDNNSCTTTNSVTITEPAVLSATNSTTQVSCPGGSNGTATVTPTGGTTPYTYIWNSSPQQYTAQATNLTEGTYTCTVTDDCGTTLTKVCNVTTVPRPTTKLRTAYCGATISSLGGYILCDPVTNAVDFEYNFVHAGSGYDQTVTKGSGSTVLYMNTIPGLTYGKTYDVKVRAQTNDACGVIWGDYSTVCQLTIDNIPLTKLRDAYCGVTTGDLNTYILCDPVGGATDYQYNFVNVALGYNQTVTRGSSTSSLYLYTVPGLQYEKTYDVKVKAYISGVWGEYGTMCQITLPSFPLTKLNSTSCGDTVDNINAIVYCNIVAGASDYQYNFVHVGSGYDQTKIRGASTIALTLNTVPGISSGKTYDVKVKGYVNGVWGDYGVVCQLTIDNNIPLTKLRDAYCGVTTGNLNTYILCDPVGDATDYQYNFVNVALGYDQTVTRGSSTTSLYLNTIPGLRYEKTYDVKVKAYVSGVWGEYGTMCQITLPSFPLTKLNSTSCGVTVANINAIIYCNVVAGASDYQYNFIHAASGYDQTKIRGASTTALTLNTVPGITTGKTYDVKVKGYVNGIWGDYGVVCQLTIGGSKSLTNNNSGINEEFINVVAYPNPFTENITIALKSSTQDIVNVSVFDVSGRIVSTYSVEPNSEFEMGSELYKGMYFIQAVDGTGQKAVVKVIKTE
ncbi:MAG: hypothetical protein A2X08_06010 [Bacteroidetes bacterium GWA2_32_17]|nr:MAG: hypothetical protein A2X08_06010 [Bacteroidetes bacterium GWA2_32_17]